MQEARVRIGTSGWNYPHWKGRFYPEDWPKARWLDFYAMQFDTVEVNATFYRLPKPETFDGWKQRTPEDFCWAVKANRFITHIKRLRDVEEPLVRFYRCVSKLGDKLGPILLQLPPSLAYDDGLVRDFLDRLDPSSRHVMEVRHPSWLQDSFFSLLEARNIALCLSDTAGRYPFHEAVTASFVYVRLHGSQKLYRSRYSRQELEAWADRIRSWNRDAYIYFDNDDQAHAPHNALELKALLQLG
ncbi:DUF72 domain-containing protein [Desulfosoma caldarium]|uniref:Uncharacterized protein YecE (DUF72 family) n=1 Tax=Desulfosoma caldarium TaxID=610254 RepID=A0A3N1UQF0_9BACT|nr:DUF72 domain-containing protein [Desulfosoma caldarium]ROQ90950.1 uncharacterized protein YecE (DUF72 family) [Desulfosoma caldarium]